MPAVASKVRSLPLLDPNAVLVADPGAVAMGSQERVVDGAVGLAWASGGRPKVVWNFLVEYGIVREIEMLASTDTFAKLDLELITDWTGPGDRPGTTAAPVRFPAREGADGGDDNRG